MTGPIPMQQSAPRSSCAATPKGMVHAWPGIQPGPLSNAIDNMWGWLRARNYSKVGQNVPAAKGSTPGSLGTSASLNGGLAGASHAAPAGMTWRVHGQVQGQQWHGGACCKTRVP